MEGPSDDIMAGPSEDMKAGPSEDMKAGPSEDMKAGPSEDMMAGPNEDMMAWPSEDMMAGPSEKRTERLNKERHLLFENLFDKKPNDFFKLLDRNIASGGADGEAARVQLEVVAKGHEPAKFLLKRNDDGDTLAHTAAKFHKKPRLLIQMFDVSPDLLMETRKDDYAGQTPLHIIISKGSCMMTRAVLEHPYFIEHRVEILRAKAVGSKFTNTVMMGQLPLSVAALTLKKKMTTLLIDHGADISWRNENKDTVFHSLIRFANVHSDKLNAILDMMRHINSRLPPKHTDIWHKAKNKDKLTPLKLAASLGLVEIFSAILDLDGVYRSLNAHDGLFDIHLYDVTEIDTVTQAEWEKHNTSLRRIGEKAKKERRQIWGPLASKGNTSKKDARESPALRHKAPAVLDIICQLPVRQAFDFICVEAVNELITLKWNYYRWFFGLWSVYHLCLMIHLTTFAIYKTKFLNSVIYPEQDISQTSRNFVNATGAFILAYACIYLCFELIRTLYFRQAWLIRLIQHNGMYRVMLLVFSLSLVIDVIWFYSHPHNNYFLILALIAGWTFMAFFLRTWKRFSFYTVMFQKVLLGDMTRLSVIIAFQLIAFSIAIYTTFLNSQPVPEGFDNAGVAIMTMFKLMLGLTDIEVLYEAREPWLAISLYIGFVLVTYVLLINSLIAMMSRTCDLISEDRNRQWELQRLSVILLLETMLLPRWRYIHKMGIKAIRRYGLHSQEYRCYIEITSVQNNYQDGKTVLQRKSLINTIGFGKEGGISLLAPLFRSVGAMNRRFHDPTPTLLRRSGLHHPTINEESFEDDEEEDDESVGNRTEDSNQDSSEDDSDDGGDKRKVWAHYSDTVLGQSSPWPEHKSKTEYIESRNQVATTHHVSKQQSEANLLKTAGDASRTSSVTRKKLQKLLLAGAMFHQRPRQFTGKPKEQYDHRDGGTDKKGKKYKYKLDENRHTSISFGGEETLNSTLHSTTTDRTLPEPAHQYIQRRRPKSNTSTILKEGALHEPRPRAKLTQSLSSQTETVPVTQSQSLLQRQIQTDSRVEFRLQRLEEAINPVRTDDKVLQSADGDGRTRRGFIQQPGQRLTVRSGPLQVKPAIRPVAGSTGINTLGEEARPTPAHAETTIPEIEITFVHSSA